MPDEQVNKEVLTEAITLLGKSFNQPKAKNIESAISLLKKSLRERRDPLKAIRADVVQDDTHEYFRLGVLWVDTWLRGGLRPGELVLIGATPHAGKTHTLAWFGIQFLMEGYQVLSVIGEDLLGDIKACYSAGVANPAALKHLWLADMQDVRFGARELEELYDSMVADGNKPEIVIVDHVDLMKGSSGGKNDWEVVSDVMVELKMFAKRTNSIVITASQINFANDQKGMARFYRAKVGKAGNADVIFMIDDVIDNEYYVSLTKARGRKRIPIDERQKVLLTDWDRMKIEDIT